MIFKYHSVLLVSLAVLVASAMSCQFWFEQEKEVFITSETDPGSVSPGSQKSIDQFKATLNKGDYGKLDSSLLAMKNEYRRNPDDRNLAKYIGYAHMWKGFEFKRIEDSPTYVDHLVNAHQYIRYQKDLRPIKARNLGWIGTLLLEKGRFFGESITELEGRRTLTEDIHVERSFNNFSAIFGLSRLPKDDPSFETALQLMWAKLDACAGETVDRDNPDFRLYLDSMTEEGPERVCWDFADAPHNFSGMFLVAGDIMTKWGIVQTATALYQNARLGKNFNTWPYRELLDSRIADVKTRAKSYSTARPAEIITDSKISCVVCHQQSKLPEQIIPPTN